MFYLIAVHSLHLVFQQKLEEDLTAANSRLENEKKNLIATHSSILEEKEQMEMEINHIQDENNQLKREKNQLKADKDELNSSNQQIAAEKIQLESLHQQEKRILQLEVERLPQNLQKYAISDNASFKHISKVSVFLVLQVLILQFITIFTHINIDSNTYFCIQMFILIFEQKEYDILTA